MSVLFRFLLWLDFGLNTLRGGYPGETVSAWCYRKMYVRAMRVINGVFRDPDHCANAFMAVKEGKYLPEEYRK